MKRKAVLGIMLTLLLVNISISMSKIRSVRASSEETYTYFSFRNITFTSGSAPGVLYSFLYNSTNNMTFGSPDANGVINLTIPKESYHMEPSYDPIFNLTRTWVPISDGYGKQYTVNGTGDVDIISMTNYTGTFFKNCTDGTWHPPGEEWIGDGESDPAGSAWIAGTINYTNYQGNDTNGPIIGSCLLDYWYTTGFVENTVIEPASLLNGSYMNVTGFPFTGVGGVGGCVGAWAKLNISWAGGYADWQWKDEILEIRIPSFSVTLSSPANLYATDPENRHIGTDPATGEPVNQIPKAFYSGPGSHPQRIIIPDPVNGVYDIKIVGTSTGSYTLAVELATLEKTTTDTYTGDISVGQILQIHAIVSEGEMTSTPPSAPVGGIYFPVNKLELLAPYIGLTILLAVAIVTAVYVMKRKRNTEINS